MLEIAVDYANAENIFSTESSCCQYTQSVIGKTSHMKAEVFGKRVVNIQKYL